MRCRHCGNIMPDGELICPVCRTEIQMVPDYNPLNDVLEDQVRGGVTQALNTGAYRPVHRTEKQNTGRTSRPRQNTGRQPVQRQNTGRHDVQHQNTGRTAASQERVRVTVRPTEAEERARRRRQAEKKRMIAKKKRQRAMIIGGIAVVLMLVIGIVCYQNSYTGLVKKGYSLMNEKEYDNAIMRFQKAINKKEEKSDAYTGLANVYIAQNDLEKAEQVYLSAIEAQNENASIYEALILFYMESNQNTKIAYLLEDCSNEAVVKELEAYKANVPEFALDETEIYDDIQALEITCDEKAIYYTTDGTEPTVSSKKYTEPIKLEEGETVVSAISVNEKDIPSVVVSKTYTIEFPIADAPSVTPSTGQYDSRQYIQVVIPDNYEAYYTLNGNDPEPGTSGTRQYTGAVKMPEGNTIFKVVLADMKGRLSDVTIRNYELVLEED